MKYTYDSATTTATPKLVVKRAHLQALDWLVWGILDPSTIHPTLRDQYEATARGAALEIKNLMCDQDFGRAGPELRLIPLSLTCNGYHQDRVEEVLLDIGEHKVNPITAMLARGQAKDVDDQERSTDFRLEGSKRVGGNPLRRMETGPGSHVIQLDHLTRMPRPRPRPRPKH